jgi:dihydrofolate reductase
VATIRTRANPARARCSAAGDRYVNVLGADIAAECIAAGVLDEVLVSVLPVLLGDGTRLSDRPSGDRATRADERDLRRSNHKPVVWRQAINKSGATHFHNMPLGNWE